MNPNPRVAPASRAEFDDLRRRGRQSVEEGRLHDAVDLFDGALVWAEEHGNPDDVDRAWCGRSAAAIELGDDEEVVPRLRKILMRNRDEENCFLAAYNVARAYDLCKEYRKALFYARVAKDRAQRLGHSTWLASSHNQMGNLLLAESFFEEATAEYRKALSYLEPESSVRQALIFDNLGYCAVVEGRHGEGFGLLFRSLRTLNRSGAQRYAAQPHAALCFAYMEVDRPRRALQHGLRALKLAETHDDQDTVKNCLYLLGEAAHLCGDTESAQATFQRLQTEFYPEVEFLSDFLLGVDVRRLVNLRA